MIPTDPATTMIRMGLGTKVGVAAAAATTDPATMIPTGLEGTKVGAVAATDPATTTIPTDPATTTMIHTGLGGTQEGVVVATDPATTIRTGLGTKVVAATA